MHIASVRVTVWYCEYMARDAHCYILRVHLTGEFISLTYLQLDKTKEDYKIEEYHLLAILHVYWPYYQEIE